MTALALRVAPGELDRLARRCEHHAATLRRTAARVDEVVRHEAVERARTLGVPMARFDAAVARLAHHESGIRALSARVDGDARRLRRSAEHYRHADEAAARHLRGVVGAAHRPTRDAHCPALRRRIRSRLGGPLPRPRSADAVSHWVEQAVGILAAHGIPPAVMNRDDIALIIRHESGGDPNAIDLVDANARRGTPSQGLMQTIGPTFARHRLPGHDDVYNPVDNIIAGVLYAIARYGSVSRVPGVVRVRHGRMYIGY